MLIDFLLDEEGDLLLTSEDDLAVGVADEQAVGLLLMSEKGAVKQDVVAGLNLLNYLHAEHAPKVELERELLIQLAYDGFVADTVEVETLDNIQITGQYVL